MREIDYEKAIEKARWLYADLTDRSRVEAKAREAARIVGEILKQRPDDYDANSLMGAILSELGQLDESIRYLDRAIAIDPTDYLAYCHKAGTLLEKGDLAGAEACARKSLN